MDKPQLAGTVARAELRKEKPAEQIMSMPAVVRRLWTLEEVEALIDAREGHSPRYELVQGELLVTPGPTHRHQRLILRLTLALQPYLTKHGIGEIELGPGELKLAIGEYYEPDLFVLEAENGRLPTVTDSLVSPMLICESLSPGSSRHDRITKRRAFQQRGVPTYWIIDGDAEVFEVWQPDDERPELVDDRVTWHPANAPEPFELDVRELFASVREGRLH